MATYQLDLQFFTDYGCSPYVNVCSDMISQVSREFFDTPVVKQYYSVTYAISPRRAIRYRDLRYFIDFGQITTRGDYQIPLNNECDELYNRIKSIREVWLELSKAYAILHFKGLEHTFMEDLESTPKTVKKAYDRYYALRGLILLENS